MDKYQPIACGLHSQYELAIMHQQAIQLRWQEADGSVHNEKLQPLDLIAQQGEEFLLAETDDGIPRKIRLDRILKHEFFSSS